MGNFLGWASYDLKMWCDHCGKEYDAEYAHEHEDCAEEMNNFKGYSLVGGMTAPGNGESEGHLGDTRSGE